MLCRLLTGGHCRHLDKVCFRPKADGGDCRRLVLSVQRVAGSGQVQFLRNVSENRVAPAS